MNIHRLEGRDETIARVALPKASVLTPDGGAARPLIASGAVQVNRQPELRRGRKLPADDVVQAGSPCVRVHAQRGTP